MDYVSPVCLLPVLLFLQIIQDVNSLRCFICIPILQSGEDCAHPRSDQLQTCNFSQDICKVTAVSLPGTNGVRTPTINRGCGAKSEFSGQMAGFMTTGQHKCVTTSEGQRVSKLCFCTFDGCNAQTMGQLVDNSNYGINGGSTVAPAFSLALGLSAALMIASCLALD